jgi:hypothetical protein
LFHAGLILIRNHRLDIGLFGLIGMVGVLIGPLMGRLIDKLVLWYSSLLATLILSIFNIVQMGAGGLSIATVIVVCFGLNVGRQLLLASLSTIVLRCVMKMHSLVERES